MPDLFLGPRVKYGETGVHMPSVGVYTQHYVALDVFDTADITIDLPRELVIRKPGCTHAQERSMRHSLGIGRDPIVLLGCKADVVRAKTRQNVLDDFEAFLGSTLLNKNKRLAFRVDLGSVQRMARYNSDVWRKIFFERCDFDLLAGCLSANNRT